MSWPPSNPVTTFSRNSVLPKDFARLRLDKQRLGQIINLASDLSLGTNANRFKDTFGHVYDYFLSRFASAEKMVALYTPSHDVRVLVEMPAPTNAATMTPASSNAKLLSLGKRRSEKFQSVLTRFGVERLVCRLSLTPAREARL